MKSTLLPFSTLLYNAILLIERRFVLFLAVITIPLITTYFCYWLLLGILLIDLRNVQSITQLQQLFSWDNSTPYLIIFSGLFIMVVTLFGLIGGPVVATYNDHIHWRTIIPRIAHYVLPYVLLTVLIGFCLFGVLLLSYAVTTIVVSIAGLIRPSFLDPTYTVLIPLLPNSILLISGIFFIFAPYVLVSHEQPKAWLALLSSVRLVKHHFWFVTFRVSIVSALLAILSSVLQFIPIVGLWLAVIISSIVLTAYNYVLYQNLLES